MKVGVITDIHGDLDGLEAALRLLRGDLAVDTVVCNGDLVDRGAEASAVVARVREANIPTVMGNHDRSAPTVERDLRFRPELREVYNTAPLDDAALEFLEGLPPTQTFDWEGVRVLLAHGSPWDVETYVRPNALRKVVLRVLDEGGADVTLLGHTHEPMAMQVGARWVFNSGAVSGAKDRLFAGRRTCGVLDLPARAFTVYDIDTAEALRLPTIKHPPP